MTVMGAVPPMIVDGIAETDGNYGPQGPAGPQGIQGETGEQGEQGIQGPVGPEGPQGIQGVPGPIGPQGEQGVKGDTGPQGPIGPEGAGIDIQGTVPHAPDDLPPTGEPGDAWMSADDGHMWAWDDDTNTWVDLGKVQGPAGPQGPIGETGPQGATGPQGEPGPVGATGVQGPIGPPGAKGDKGDQGIQGPQGPQGIQGVPGTDGSLTPHAIKHASGGTDEILNINAARLTSGLLPDARLSTRVAFKDIDNYFSAQHFGSGSFFQGANSLIVLFATAAPVNKRSWRLVHYGDASGALQLQPMTDDQTGVNQNYYWTQDGIFYAPTLSTNNFNASYINSGTIPDARLSANVPLKSTPNIFTQPQYIQSGNPSLYLYDVAQPANLRNWRIMNQSQTLIFYAQDDGESGWVNTMNINRVGDVSITRHLGVTGYLNVGNAAGNVALKNVSNSFLAAQDISCVNPILSLLDTVGPANLKRYSLLVTNGNFYIQTYTDAGGWQSNALQLDYTGNLSIGGGLTCGGARINSSFAQITFNENTQPVDKKIFRIYGYSQTFNIDSVNDAITVAYAGFQMNRDGVVSMAGQPRTYMTKTSPSAPGSGQTYIVGWENVGYNVGGCWTGGSLATRFTANINGTYVVSATVNWQANAAGYRQVAIVKSSGEVIANTYLPAAPGGVPTLVCVSAVSWMYAGEYIYLHTVQGSGLDLQVAAEMRWTKVS